MDLRHFENKARQAWWSVHVEAWYRSGLSRTRYCRDHGLNRRTFSNWMIYLVGREEARKHEEYRKELRREQSRKNLEKGRERRRKGLRFGERTDMQSRAVQAFWSMHAEALNWSGMSLRHYAMALNLSRRALGKWRKRLEDGELEINWRVDHRFEPDPFELSFERSETTCDDLWFRCGTHFLEVAVICGRLRLCKV